MFMQLDKKNKRSMHHFGHGFSALVIVWLVTRTTFCQELTTTQAPPRTLQVRLVDGTTPSEGRVEVLYNGTWSTICDDSWDLPDAHVACRMLGYPGAESALASGFFGPGEAGILLDDVECIGNETSLEDCQHPGFYEHNCQHYEDAGVVCRPRDSSATDAPPTTIPPQIRPVVYLQVRLIGGATDREGRVEVYYNGSWGTVCDGLWGNRDGNVVCRMLGLGEAQLTQGYGAGEGPIFLDNVTCKGTENNLGECQHPGLFENNCSHAEDAGVKCSATTQAPPKTLQVRLVDGTTPSEGRVEVLYNGTWSTICDDSWDLRDADVTCRMLGYPGAQSALANGFFGPGEGGILLDDVECIGNEPSLEDCQHPGFYEHNCQHYEDAAVVCWPRDRKDVRLVNGLTLLEGRVEVLIDGTWGTVCDENWDYNDALVVCRSLAFTGALGTTSLSEFGPSDGVMHSYDFQCNGTESNILECLRNNSESKPQCRSHSREAGVRCEDCKDVHPLCTEWARYGHCELSPAILRDCQYSCNQCNIFAMNDVAGHCYLDSNNDLFCIATPIRPIPSSIRCMTFNERAQTNLTTHEVISALTDTLRGLPYYLDVENFLQLLPQNIYQRQRQASVLILSGYEIQHIEDNAFTAFTSLLEIDLTSNSIQHLERGVFSGLQSIRYIDLSDNKIQHIEVGAFDGLHNLRYVDLTSNSIQHLERGVFSGLQFIKAIYLSNNKIRDIEVGAFDGIQYLRSLDLSSNSIQHLESGVFSGFQSFLLNLSSNSIQHLRRGVFSGLQSLEFLDLMYNNIQGIEGFTFESLPSLKFLFFHDSELGAIDRNTLAGLTSMEKMSTSDNRLCCLLEDNVNFTCARTSPSGPLETCSRLFPNLALRIAGWFMGLLALGGNGVVLFVRLRDRKEHTSKVQNTMIGSLAMADILMGLYMIIITSADVYYGDEFYLSAPQWRDSHMCRFAGFLGFLSSEASVFTLTLITVDRFISIVFPFGKLKIQHKGSLILVGLAWSFTIVLSLGLVIVTSYRPDIYGLSDVCLGLPLHVETQDTGMLVISRDQYDRYEVDYENTNKSFRPPWLFSIIIFIGLNLVSFAFILVCYILIFIKASRSSAEVRNTKSHKQDTKLAVRMALLVATDLACWMPVIIMGILSQTGAVTLDPSLYAWTVILIVPINSSINPFLYTFIMYIDDRKKKKKKIRKSKDNQVNLPEVQTNAV